MIRFNFLIRFRNRMHTVPIMSSVTLYCWSGIWVFNSSITVRRVSCASSLCQPMPLPQGSSNRRIWNIGLARWRRSWMAGSFLKAFKVWLAFVTSEGFCFFPVPLDEGKTVPSTTIDAVLCQILCWEVCGPRYSISYSKVWNSNIENLPKFADKRWRRTGHQGGSLQSRSMTCRGLEMRLSRLRHFI